MNEPTMQCDMCGVDLVHERESESMPHESEYCEVCGAPMCWDCANHQPMGDGVLCDVCHSDTMPSVRNETK